MNYQKLYLNWRKGSLQTGISEVGKDYGEKVLNVQLQTLVNAPPYTYGQVPYRTYRFALGRVASFV